MRKMTVNSQKRVRYQTGSSDSENEDYACGKRKQSKKQNNSDSSFTERDDAQSDSYQQVIGLEP
jgi:hypothetical protein